MEYIVYAKKCLRKRGQAGRNRRTHEEKKMVSRSAGLAGFGVIVSRLQYGGIHR